MKHLTTLKELSLKEILQLLKRAGDFKRGEAKSFEGKVVANLFFEPSTRTQNSFIMAEKKLAMSDINLNPQVSSLTKGESLYDTVKTFEAIGVDALVIRAKEDRYFDELTPSLSIPLLNGGDGKGDHPTQSLLDLMTIQEEFGQFQGLKVLICGDISHSRVAKTNVEVMRRLGMEVYLAAPKEFRDPAYDYHELDEVLQRMDVVMLLRIQHERHGQVLAMSQDEYLKTYGITKERAKAMKSGAIIMHPAPVNRGWEIDTELVESERSRIFPQMANGVYVRMAVLERALEG